MTDSASKSGPQPFTHTAFLCRKIVHKKMMLESWGDCGEFKQEEDGSFTAQIDWMPRAGWDGRIRFIKHGNPPPGAVKPAAPQRPGAADADEIDGDGEE
jgi:hypothetical protein